VVVLGMLIFAVLVIIILLFDRGCSTLKMSVPPFTGEFNHCAAALAGGAAEEAIRGVDLPDDVASAARKAAEDAVIKSLDRGETPEEAAEEAASSAFEAARNAGASDDEASLAAAAAGGSAAAAAAAVEAGGSLKDSELVAIAAADEAISGGDEGAAEDAALESGASPDMVNFAGTGAGEGAVAAQNVQEGRGEPTPDVDDDPGSPSNRE
jgi:hypothetical protein